MRIFITGGSGQVGQELIRLRNKKNSIFCTPAHSELDIKNPLAVQQALMDFKPDIVINTAAYTAVDAAEKNFEEAHAVNALGAKNIAIACNLLSCPLLHLSTDYVFSGSQKTAYTEQDTPDPVNLYGKSKLEGELAIREYCEKHIILRVSSVFGFYGKNFVKTILSLARNQEMLRIVADQTSCPTPAKSIAQTLLEISNVSNWGIYHYCGDIPVTWYELANQIILEANSHKIKLQVKDIKAISTEDYPTPAKRPAYSVLDCNKIKNIGITQPDWRTELSEVVRELSTS